MDDEHRTVPQVHVPAWYSAAIPALLAALTAVVILARVTA